MKIQPNNLSIPQKIDKLANQMNVVMQLLAKNQPNKEAPKNLTLEQAITVMEREGCPLSKSSLYKLTSSRKIPFNRFGRKLIFDRDEILQWCKDRIFLDAERKITIDFTKKFSK